MGDKASTLFSVARGSKRMIAVRVATDGYGRPVPEVGPDGVRAWSQTFSLLNSPPIGGHAYRSIRAGSHDLAVHIAPLDNTDHGRITVVTFTQRFWLTNKLSVSLECEQWASPTASGVDTFPLAANERCPFHWPKDKEEQLLRVRPAPGSCSHVPGYVPSPKEGWSSGFPIDSPGKFIVHCEQGVSTQEEGWWDSLLRIVVQARSGRSHTLHAKTSVAL
eukprot:6178958-Pleurochrysis_carterae.AAC.2